MKSRSVLLLAALLVPVGGAYVAKTGLMPDAAYADSPSYANLLAQSTAPSEKPEGRMRRGGMGEQWGKELNLTTQQQADIKAIRDQEKTGSEGLRQQMKTAHDQLETLMSGNASDAQIRSQYQQVQQIKQQLGDRRFDTMLKIRNVLTPEQRTKAAELMKQHKGRHSWGDRKEKSGAASGSM